MRNCSYCCFSRNGASPSIKIYFGYKIMIAFQLEQLVALSEKHLMLISADTIMGTWIFTKLFHEHFLSVVFPLLPSCRPFEGIVEQPLRTGELD